MNNSIFINEVGYLPGERKIGIYRGELATNFMVYRREGDREKLILSGYTEEPGWNEAAKEKACAFDFSEISESGVYWIRIPNEKDSAPFQIGPNVYQNVMKDMLHFFYLQRCGQALERDYAGDFAHPACHKEKARLYGTKEYIDVSGGWHDAGDYGRYVVAAAVTIAGLLYGIKSKNDILEIPMNIPGRKEYIPDLLTEIRYELEWMLKMQDSETGKVYHKVSCASFCDFVMPEEEKEELILCDFSLTATADFAACMAMAVAFYKPYDIEFAKRMEKASRSAYEAMRDINVPGGFKNPEGVETGTYEDEKEEDERYWAAAELYKAFGDERYRTDFEEIASQVIYHGYGWEDVGSFGNLAYLSTLHPTTPELCEDIKQSMIDKADGLLEICKENLYQISFLPKDYIWGSNMYLMENGSHLYDAYILTGNDEYLKMAKEHIHYLLGKNPCGVCFVTGNGTNSPKNPHHRPSSAIKEAMPGMVIGGPNFQMQDPSVEEACKGFPPAKCYLDTLLSYSTNEETIYWNSATIMLFSQVC